MDRSSIVVLTICFILLVLWFPFVNTLYPPETTPSGTNQVDQVGTNQTNATTNGAPEGSTSSPSIPPTTWEKEAPAAWDTSEEEILSIEDEDTRLAITSHGGGIKRAFLKPYDQVISCGATTNDAPSKWVTLNDPAAYPIMGLHNQTDWGDGIFDLSRENGTITARHTLTNGVELIHEFQLSTNYLVNSRIRIENPTDAPIKLPYQGRVIGTATPIHSDDQARFQGVYWYDGSSSKHIGPGWYANRMFGCIPGEPRSEYLGGSNLVWGAVHNRFFSVLTMPDEPAPRLRALKLPLRALGGSSELTSPADPNANPIGYQASFVYPQTVLDAGQTWERQYQLYIGPKKYNRLSQFDDEQDVIMDFGYLGFFSKILLSGMNGLHSIGLPYGWAIVVITALIKFVFWPLTRAGTRSMKRMQALQPEMKALQEKYKDDPTKMNQKLMEFMKQNRVNPMGGCLPMLVQIPVFIGFFFMIKSAIELRGASFLWICDLSQPDTVWTIPGIDFPVNPMPILMTATMLWQMSLTPAAPGMDPMQQKLMRYMPLIIVVFLYNFSAGLTLYWTVQNLLTVVQTKLTKAQDEQTSAPSKKATPTPSPAVPKGKKKKKKS